jgi:hypothetical protein
MRKFPLYTASLEGKAYDGRTSYELVIITKWSDTTASAKELEHKAYYIDAPYVYLEKKREDENWCKELMSYPEYSKFTTKEVLVNV